MHTLDYMRSAQEDSKDVWKLNLLPALEYWKNFCIFDYFVVFDDAYIIQHNA